MSTKLKGLIREEKGAALVLTLVLLLIGGLIIAPLLGHMGTGHTAGQVHEKRMDELYAADAGVEDAISRIRSGEAEFIDGWYYPEPLSVNGKTVTVKVLREDLDETCNEELRYTISSNATGLDGSFTTIDAYLSVLYMDFSSLLDNAIVSDHSIIIRNGMHVTGPVTSGGTVDDKNSDDDAVPGPITKDAILDWPSAEELSSFYLSRVQGAVRYGGNTLIDLEGNSCPPGPIYRTIDKDKQAVSWLDGLGPLYVDGKLNVTSSDSDEEVTLTLNGTLYITGDTEIYGPNSNEPSKLTIDLNGNTIFVASPSSKSRTPPDAKPALSIENVNIVGSGAIIAVGDVYFAPKGHVGSDKHFVLVMSIEGTTTLQPSGNFYGCIAGRLLVDAKSGDDATVIHTSPEGKGLDFPMGIDPDDLDNLPPVTGLTVQSWLIETGS